MINPLEEALQAEGISGQLADLARGVYGQESSNGRNTKTSNAGAVGGMQILPKTFSSVADSNWDINDPVHNARAGVRYLKQLHNQTKGDLALTAVGYYGGPKAIEKARIGEAVRDPRNPNAPDTFEYADQVLNRLPNPASYNRLTRKNVAVTPVAPPVNTNMYPTEIPAYHGTPDEWSKFGRAMPDEKPVTPVALDFGNAAPIVKPVDGNFLQRFMPASVAPTVAAFKSWLK